MWQLRNGGFLAFLSSFLLSALDSLSKLSTFESATAQATGTLAATTAHKK
jgi:hypothetical protein